jgi:hypothetical protein
VRGKQMSYSSHHEHIEWGDKQIARFNFRVALFKRRGMSEQDAETWADRLFERDHEHDDRRICLECLNFQRSRTCAKRLPTSPEQLMRCAGFDWVRPT